MKMNTRITRNVITGRCPVYALLLLVLLLAACSAESVETGDTVDGESASIRLEVGVNTVTDETRGAPITTSTLQSIGLMGYRYSDATTFSASASTLSPDSYIYNYPVLATNSWDTEHSWPGPDMKLAFFGYSPYGAKGVTMQSSAVTGYPLFSYTLPTEAKDQADLMVAQAVDITRVPADLRTIVPMTFDHLCAQVKVVTGTEDGMPPGTIKAIRFVDVLTTANYQWGTGWTNVTTLGTVEASNIIVTSKTNADLATGEATFMMIPQTLQGTAKIQVEYNDGTVFEKNINPDHNIVWEQGGAYSYTVNARMWDFAYTGGVQTFTAPVDGIYKLEVWGATGGGISRNGTGALGGYAYGEANLIQGQTLYICVGGSGRYVGDNKGNYNISGGYNGGGKGGYSSRNYAQGFGGGGATHIAKVTGTLATIGLSNAINNVYVVAGGGGGSDDLTDGQLTNADYPGGVGGGATGGDAGSSTNSGAQRSTSRTYTFGQGQNAPTSNDCGGGGGGWYGGLNLSSSCGGGGGSGYTNSTLLLATPCGMVSGATNIPYKSYLNDTASRYSSRTQTPLTTANWHGFARITLVSSN